MVLKRGGQQTGLQELMAANFPIRLQKRGRRLEESLIKRNALFNRKVLCHREQKSLIRGDMGSQRKD